MRVMILGAGGMLGRDLVSTAPTSAKVFAFSKAELDMTDTGALASLLRDVGPDVIVNAAGFTKVDHAESEKSLAFRVNGEAVGALAEMVKQHGVRLVHFSTDYVFDGTARIPYTESDATHPINTYGASKLAGEVEIQASGAAFLIIRTQWLFGVHGRSFPRTMWERAVKGVCSNVVQDQVGRPTYTIDLSQATWKLIDANAEGVVHVANAGTATWYDIAKQVYAARHLGHLVRPCRSAEFPTLAHRPTWSVLDTAKMEALLGTRLDNWQDAIARFLRSAFGL